MRESPIQQILGVENAANPFEVLGLPVDVVSDSVVVDALAARVKAVAAHPMSETPEGNEVRLALHAAAAQLLDPRIRQALYDRAGLAPDRAPPARVVSGSALGPRAMMVIAAEGGWNAHALRRLAMLAHAEGIPSTAIPQTLRGLVGESHGAPPVPQSERRGRTPKHRSASRESDRIGLGVTAGITALAIVMLGATWLLLSRSLGETAPAVVPSQTVAEQEVAELDESLHELPPRDASPSEPAPVAEPEEPDWSAALIGVRDAGGPIDAQTVLMILDGIASDWARLDARPVRRVVSAFVDVVYLLPNSEALGLVNTMADLIRDDDPGVACLNAGLLSRLAVERSLPTQLDNAVIAALVSTIDTSRTAADDEFIRGAAAGLRYNARGWVSDPPSDAEATRWLVVADAIARLSPDIGAVSIRETLAMMIRSGPDPLSSSAALSLIERLAERVSPTADPESAGLVLSLLSDQAITTRAVSALVNAIARRTPDAPGAEPIRLSPTASDSERADVRALASERWLGASALPEELGVLREAIREHLQGDVGQTPSEQLADSVVSAGLANACRMVLWGDAERAVQLAEAGRSDVDAVLAGRRSSGSPRLSDGSEPWAVRYLEAKRNIPVRLSLLGELAQRPREVGPITAEIIVAEALNGSPARVRREAHTVVARLSNQATVLNGLLEQLPTAPRVPSVQELVETAAQTSLIGIRDPDWPMMARRAIVDRLLEVLAADGSSAAIDTLAAMLSDEYGMMLGNPPGSGERASVLAEGLVEERVAEILRTDLAGNSSAYVDARLRSLAGRRSLAEGTAMTFAAAQVTATELLAEIVALEYPHKRPELDQVLGTLSESRSRARSVFEQIAAAERASLQIWAHRVGVEP